MPNNRSGALSEVVATRMSDPDDLLTAYDEAVSDLAGEFECGWNEDNCRPAMQRRIRRLRRIVLRRLSRSGDGPVAAHPQATAQVVPEGFVVVPRDEELPALIWEKLRWATEQRLARDYRTVSFGEQECRWLLNLLESSKEQKELAKEPRNAR